MHYFLNNPLRKYSCMSLWKCKRPRKVSYVKEIRPLVLQLKHMLTDIRKGKGDLHYIPSIYVNQTSCRQHNKWMLDREYKPLTSRQFPLCAKEACTQNESCVKTLHTQTALLTRKHRPLCSSETSQGLCNILELPVRSPTVGLVRGTTSKHVVTSNLRE